MCARLKYTKRGFCSYLKRTSVLKMTDRVSLDYRRSAFSTSVLIAILAATATSVLARKQGADGACREWESYRLDGSVF